MAAKLLPFVTKAEREIREGMKRFLEWKRKTRAWNQSLAESEQCREPVIAEPQKAAPEETKK
jgi:hypothetical protein